MSSPGPGRAQKTPEMDVSGRDKNALKTWAHNFEKQKNESKKKSAFKNQRVFFKKSIIDGPTSDWDSYTGKKKHWIEVYSNNIDKMLI